jgi:hypothetical protein
MESSFPGSAWEHMSPKLCFFRLTQRCLMSTLTVLGKALPRPKFAIGQVKDLSYLGLIRTGKRPVLREQFPNRRTTR